MSNLEKLDLYFLVFFGCGFLILLTLISVFWSYSFYLRVLKKVERIKRMEFEYSESIREMISNDLHDVGASVLTELKLKVTEIEGLENGLVKDKLMYLKSRIDEFSDLLRNSIEDIYPKEFLYGDWIEAINELVRRYNTNQLNIFFTNEVKNPSLIPLYKSTQIFRITQELISNAIKHLHPSCILIELFEMDNCLIIFIDSRDVNFEFNRKKTLKGRGSFHLQKRLKLINAMMEVNDNYLINTQLITIKIR